MSISLNDRLCDFLQLLDAHFQGLQAMMWTALPAIVERFDASTITCDVQPAILGKIEKEDGTVEAVKMPMLLDCPVVFPHAGNCSITFPIKKGDECLVVFSSRAIDFWWQSGGVQPPAETRMHDLSDGFVLLAPYSQVKKISGIASDAVSIRSDDGSASVSLNPSSHAISIVAPGNVRITGDVIVEGDVKANGISLTGHVHGGVSSGPDSTGGPR